MEKINGLETKVFRFRNKDDETQIGFCKEDGKNGKDRL